MSLDLNTLSKEQLKYLVNLDNKHANKAASNVNTSQLLYGSGGLWDAAGADDTVINNYMTPEGLRSKLPIFPSLNENPIWFTLTGIASNNAGAPDAPCHDSEAGFMKGCALTSQFGRLQFDTNTIEMNKISTYDNLGVTRNLGLQGQLFNPNNRQVSGLPSQADMFNNVIAEEMGKVGMLFQVGSAAMLGHNREVWQGDPTNNTAQGGYKEFPGLDLQINTGQVDAYTGVACPNMDSDVKDFGYQNLAIFGTNTIVRTMSYLQMYVENIARKTGLWPVQWVWVMRPETWIELSAIWPIAYNTNRGSSFMANRGFTGNLDTINSVGMTDAMRNSLTIDVNGKTFPVVVDDGIFESNNINNGNLNAGEFSSTIYLVPLTIGTGNVPVTFLEYSNYGQWARDSSILPDSVKTFWTDGGMYSWAYEGQKWCFKLSAKTEQRVILKTPQLAGRIDNVMCEPLQHMRDTDPTSPYFINGGVSTRGPVVNTSAVWKS